MTAKNLTVRRGLGVGERSTVVLLDGEDVSARCISFDAEAGWVELIVLKPDGTPVVDWDGQRCKREHLTGRVLAWSADHKIGSQPGLTW